MSELWLEDPLGYLIGPERIANFFAKTYEREALIVHHNAAQRFEGLLSIDDVDRIVTSVDLRKGQLTLADATRELSTDQYVDSSDYIDRGAVADQYRGGATIILNQAHQFEPKLARLCKGLEHVFSSHVQANLYLTPPNAQGFRTHYDNHDVLVIQIEGEKAWRLYDQPIEAPFRGEGFEPGKHETGALRQEFVLKAGDCAYVPRGLMHDALTSGDQASLHITVGLITRTWADLMLEAVSEVALRSPELRRSLPAGFAQPNFNRDAARKALSTLAGLLAQEIKLDPALDLMVDTFIRSRPAENRFSVLNAGKNLTAQERFVLKRHAPFRIAEDGDDIVLIGPGGDIDFTAGDRPALERALNGAPFGLADLKGEKVDALVSTLLAYGLVVRV